MARFRVSVPSLGCAHNLVKMNGSEDLLRVSTEMVIKAHANHGLGKIEWRTQSRPLLSELNGRPC